MSARGATLLWALVWLAALLALNVWCWARGCLSAVTLTGLALWTALTLWAAWLALSKRDEPGQIRTLTGEGKPRMGESVSTESQPLDGDQPLPLEHDREVSHHGRESYDEPAPVDEPAPGEAAGGEHTGPGRE